WAHGRQQADSVRLMLTEPALQGELAKAHAAAEAMGEGAAACYAEALRSAPTSGSPLAPTCLLGIFA
ncbi:hypothetical protein DEF28_26310, partial [Marinitenerispora sediminis]